MTRNRYGSSPRHRAPSDEAVRVGSCTAVIGSMTVAMGAQRVLADAAIRATVVKVSSAKSTGGCAYGVDFPCTQMSNAKIVLNGAGIRVREFLQG